MKLQTVAPHQRREALDAEQHRKMAESAHAFVRGSTVQFYRWIEGSTRRALPEGPPVWICGDCHVGNLGPIAGIDGELRIQIRDLDQTVIGNPAHDLIRLALSLAMSARGSDLPGVTTARMVERMVQGYEAAFQPEADRAPAGAMPRMLRQVMRAAANRSWKHLADERIEGMTPDIPLGKRFWPLTRDERRGVEMLFEQDELRRLVTMLRRRDADAPVRVVDAAFWKKGCSSLGRLRLAVLVSVGDGRHARHCLMDLKEATDAAVPFQAGSAMPADEAERVVAGARQLSPLLGERMVATTLLGRPVFVRELLPQDLKLEIEHLNQAEAIEVAEYLANVVGISHARQMDEEARAAWFEELGRNRSSTLEAPTWLWDSVVDLVGLHEAAYLRHCRRWAMEPAG